MKTIIVKKLAIGEGMPKICVPIVGKTKADILGAAEKICKTPADLIEWRADWFEGVFDVEVVCGVLSELRTILGEMPLLFTFRTKTEGGEQEISNDEYEHLLLQVSHTGLVDMIDVEAYLHEEIPCLISKLKENGVVIVGSNHDFAKTPEKDEIVKRLVYMKEVGADLPKIAVMPKTEADVETLLTATKEVANLLKTPIITMAMGKLGEISRTSGEIYGSAITFGAVGTVSAPGQIYVFKLKEILEKVHREKAE
jgi:3-dehydroquinate dehydratase-1